MATGTVNVGVQPPGVEAQKLAIKKYGSTTVQHSDTSGKAMYKAYSEPAIPENIIEEKRQTELVGDNSPIVFPSNLTSDFYIGFNAYSYNNDPKFKRANEVTRSFKLQKSVFLPLPTNITDSYGASYNPENLYFFGNALKGQLDNFMQQDGTKSVSNILSKETLNKAVSSLADVIEKTSAADIAAVGGTYLMSGMGGPLAGAAKTSFQVTTNPFPVMIYGGTGFKSFSFSWTFYPEDYQESEIIKKIVGYFRREMLPEQHEKYSSILKTPAIFEIKMKPDEHTKQFKRSVITGMDVNYTPAGPAFIYNHESSLKGQDLRVPAAVSLTLNFQEIEIWLANDFYDTEEKLFDFKTAKNKLNVPSNVAGPNAPPKEDPEARNRNAIKTHELIRGIY
jgi:hypothetical protein